LNVGSIIALDARALKSPFEQPAAAQTHSVGPPPRAKPAQTAVPTD